MKPAAPSDFAAARVAPVPGDAPERLSRRGFLLGTLGLAGLTTTAVAAYGVGIEAQGLVVTDYRLTPPHWPAGSRLTVTVIADLHAGGPNMGLMRVREVVETANRLESDLVVLLGDYFASHRFMTERVPHAAWAGELARLTAPLGVWAILGNHDWWHDIAGVRRALADVRIPVMENDAVLLRQGDHPFWLAGLGDQLAYRLGPRRFRGVDDLPGMLRRISTDDPLILLVHEPDIFPVVPARASLTLAGHTHGGQIRVPLVWPMLVPSNYGARFAYGHIVEAGRHMVVSGGIGTSAVPLRIGVPPEIVRIEVGG
jgi:predicted MPP superfamily phosphohydrolase